MESHAVKNIIEGWARPISSSPIDKVINYLSHEIPLIANSYGAREAITTDILQEAVEVVFTRFPHYGVTEIREAYRHAFSQPNNDNNKSIEMFGKFTAANIGKVLSLYTRHRKKVVNNYMRDYTLRHTQESEAERKARSIADFNANFDEYLKDEADKDYTFEQIPIFLYDACKRRQLIDLSQDEINDLTHRSREMALSDLRAQLSNETDIWKRKRILQEIDSGQLFSHHLFFKRLILQEVIFPIARKKSTL